MPQAKMNGEIVRSMSKTKGGNKKKGFLRKMLRAGKKRAPSVDETITSLEDSQRSSDTTPSFKKSPVAVASTAIVEEPQVPEWELPPAAVNNAANAASDSRELGKLHRGDSNYTSSSDSVDRIAGNDNILYEQNVVLKSRLEALRAQQKLSGSDHPDVLFAMQSLGLMHCQRGEYHHAQRVFEERQRLTSAKSAIPREICVATTTQLERQHVAPRPSSIPF